jgi:tetratricopeptide (TPR) repeat protein
MDSVESGKIECSLTQPTCSYLSRKSQLAIDFAHTWKSNFRDGWVFWIHASSAERFDHSVRDILNLLRIHGRESPHANLHELFRNWLIDTRGRRWLLVLDNADEANYLLESPAVTSQANHSTRNPSGDRRLDYIPTCNHGAVLITTRSRDMCSEMVHRNHMLEIRPMNAEHALEMMQKKIGMQDQEDDIIRLATALDFMPLAVAQAAAYIHKRAPRCSVQQYIEKLHRSQKSKLSLLNRDEPDLRRDREASNSILSTWQISFEHVRDSRPGAADLLSFMSFFDRQAIPGALLLASTKCDSIDGSDNGEVNDLADDNFSDSRSDSSSKEDELEEDIQLLRDYSFISVTSDPTVFEMHALVQLATQMWLSGNARYSQWRNRFIQVLDDKFPEIDSSNWAKAKAIFPHAFAALHLDAAGTYAQPLLASLLYNAGHYAYWTHARANAERLWSTSLRISTRLFGEKHLRPRLTMFKLAWAYYDQMQMDKAEQLFLQLLSLTESLRRQNRKDLSGLDVMSGLSLMYRSQERLEEAELWSLQVLELADDHEDTMIGLKDLAAIYSRQGRWEESEQLLLRAVEIGKDTIGADAERTLDVTVGLGRLYLDQGRLHEAEQTLSRVQESRQDAWGSNAREKINAMIDLGKVYQKQGRLDEAELILSRVQQSLSTLLGSDHEKTLSSKMCLAAVYEDQGRIDEARELYTHILELQRSTIGMDQPKTLHTMAMLYYLEPVGNLEATVILAKTLLDASTRVLGAAHNDTLRTMTQLALSLRLLGRRRSATDLIGRCALLSYESLGPSHPNTVERDDWVREWEADDAREEHGSSAEPSQSGIVASEEERNAKRSDQDELQGESTAELKGTDEGPLEGSDLHVKVWLMPDSNSAGACREMPALH